MKVEYRKQFLKELAKIPSKTREAIEKFVFEEAPQLESIFETGKFDNRFFAAPPIPELFFAEDNTQWIPE